MVAPLASVVMAVGFFTAGLYLLIRNLTASPVVAAFLICGIALLLMIILLFFMSRNFKKMSEVKRVRSRINRDHNKSGDRNSAI